MVYSDTLYKCPKVEDKSACSNRKMKSLKEGTSTSLAKFFTLFNISADIDKIDFKSTRNENFNFFFIPKNY